MKDVRKSEEQDNGDYAVKHILCLISWYSLPDILIYW